MRKTWWIVAMAVGIWAGVAWAGSDELPECPKPQAEHEWLTQLAGEWEFDLQAFPPGQEPMRSKGTETVRSIGGFWIVAENRCEMMGQPFTGLLTLGYDPSSKSYLGTWVDSMGSHLWTYRGSVDAAGKKLTLDTEGPSCTEPGKLCKFREVLEVKGKDHKVFSASVQGDDGQWASMMTIEYRRKK